MKHRLRFLLPLALAFLVGLSLPIAWNGGGIGIAQPAPVVREPAVVPISVGAAPVAAAASPAERRAVPSTLVDLLVRDAEGRPIEGATVAWVKPGTRLPTPELGRTDAQGRAAVRAPEAPDARVFVVARGWLPEEVGVVAPGQSWFVTMRRGAEALLALRDLADRPIPGLQVSLSCLAMPSEVPAAGVLPIPDPGSAIFQGITDASGSVQFAGLPIGTFEVRLAGGWFALDSSSPETPRLITANQPVQMSLQATRLVGCAVHFEGDRVVEKAIQVAMPSLGGAPPGVVARRRVALQRRFPGSMCAVSIEVPGSPATATILVGFADGTRARVERKLVPIDQVTASEPLPGPEQPAADEAGSVSFRVVGPDNAPTAFRSFLVAAENEPGRMVEFADEMKLLPGAWQIEPIGWVAARALAGNRCGFVVERQGRTEATIRLAEVPQAVRLEVPGIEQFDEFYIDIRHPQAEQPVAQVRDLRAIRSGFWLFPDTYRVRLSVFGLPDREGFVLVDGRDAGLGPQVIGVRTW